MKKKKSGSVCLIGAGPGDPGLITAAGLNRLRQADVVVYDALVNRHLLAEAPTTATRIDVGKRGGNHKVGQDRINELLASEAGGGKFVVRLKGGDPYVFGRGAEEAIFLAQHGIQLEVIPGVTAAVAAPAMAGIPLTCRQLASTVTFVTGHEDPAKDRSAVDYGALAQMACAGGTICFYMAAARLPRITEKLVACGLPGSTPAAVIQWGTLARQRTVRSTVQQLAGAARHAGIGAPAIVVVGAVAGIDEAGLDFMARRPLSGQRIVHTRSRPQASELTQRLSQLGADVLEAPTIELTPPDNWDPVDQAVSQMNCYDWLILTSANGVEGLASRVKALGCDGRHFGTVKIAAIGPATAQALWRQLALRADLVPGRFTAEVLADELICDHDVAGKKLLLLRADIARPLLAQRLTAAGAAVRDLEVYRTKLTESLPEEVTDALASKSVDWVTFTSSSTATNMLKLLGNDRDLLRHVKIASIGPITSQTIRDLGLEVSVEAEPYTVDGLVEAMLGG